MSKYRSVLFGVSVLSIIILHYFDRLPYSTLLTKLYLYGVGSIGVELFVLLSGLGLYYSFRKKPPLLTFYAHRFKRLLVPYLFIAVPLLLLQTYPVLHEDILYFLRDISSVSFWCSGDRVIWYIPFILSMYLLYPVFDAILTRSEKIYLTLIPISVVLLCVLQKLCPVFYSHCEIALWRIPVFEIGVLLGKFSYEKRPVRISWPILIAVGLSFKLSGLFVDYPGRFVNCIYGLTLLLLLTVMIHWLNLKRFWMLFSAIGNFSLEIYLSHVILRECATKAGFDMSSLPVYCVVILLSIPIAVVAHLLSGKLLLTHKKESVKQHPEDTL